MDLGWGAQEVQKQGSRVAAIHQIRSHNAGTMRAKRVADSPVAARGLPYKEPRRQKIGERA